MSIVVGIVYIPASAAKTNPSHPAALPSLPAVWGVSPWFRQAGAREPRIGSRPHNVAKAETTGYARAFRRAFDWQQRCRLR